MLFVLLANICLLSSIIFDYIRLLCMYDTHARMRLCTVFYDSNFRRVGSEIRIRDREEEGELPCRYLQDGQEYSS